MNVRLRLSESERERVRVALEAAQSQTQARIALMVVPVSDRYMAYPMAWAGVLALALGAILALAWPYLPLRLAFLAEAAAFGVSALALDWLPLRLAVVPGRVKQGRARNLAHREFGAGILAAEDHRGGVLFFASLGERCVEIISTRDVHARVGDEAWNEIVSQFSATARQGKIADAIVAALNACGALLETHYPRPTPTEAHA